MSPGVCRKTIKETINYVYIVFGYFGRKATLSKEGTEK